MENLESEIRECINNQDFEGAFDKLDEAIQKDLENTKWLITRAELYYSIKNLPKALNDFNKVLKKEKDNKFIISKVEMIKEILRFEQPDIYGSTNLNNDPWLD